MSFCIISRYLKKLFLVIVAMTSRQVFSSCPLNNYYDPHLDQCHPCSDCDYPRTPNQFCLIDCPGHRCEPGKYYDKHTKNCHLCTECKPPLTPNEFCQAQCTDDERNGRTISGASMLQVATSGVTPLTGLSDDNIIIVVLCTIMGTVVLVLVTLGFLYWRKCLCKDKSQAQSHLPELEQHTEPFITHGTRNGQHSVSIEMHSLPAPRSDEPQQNNHHNFSLPIYSNQSSNCNNNQTNCMRQEDSVALLDDRDRTVSGTPLGSDTSATLPLETSHQFKYSPSQDRSLKGNVVCQPENEELERCQFLPSVCQGNRDAGEVHGILSPSSTRDAEQPHLSFDPNKDCGYEDRTFPNSSSMDNGFQIQTSLKSSC